MICEVLQKALGGCVSLNFRGRLGGGFRLEGYAAMEPTKNELIVLREEWNSFNNLVITVSTIARSLLRESVFKIEWTGCVRWWSCDQ
jgi:hypothetical protein